MTNLLTRMADSLKADLHEILNQKEEKNPIAMLNHYLRECEKETEKVRGLVERQMKLKDEFRREMQLAGQMAAKRKHQAQVAEQAGERELMEFAKREQAQYSEREQHLSRSYEETAKQLEQLEQKYEEMNHKLKDMHVRRMELMGRENIARAHAKMNKILRPSEDSFHSSSRFEEMEQYIDRLEYQVQTDYYRSTIDAKTEALEKGLNLQKTNSPS
ncbi:PspA/IM30 family protein [Bacillus sp. FJAT-42376]|uniref:PspA/IM30 family protein n=1 Tax=Bacillus sp. FJAT-42376 TaxID=2014076 RepID=UPI000F4E9968|nr:PspA/IM30 family protein [Bacillus sp. FJAT-42376]AZB43070.1 PspA/IM30 family protein [Bacillus sp. FJAT-42376]